MYDLNNACHGHWYNFLGSVPLPGAVWGRLGVGLPLCHRVELDCDLLLSTPGLSSFPKVGAAATWRRCQAKPYHMFSYVLCLQSWPDKLPRDLIVIVVVYAI